MIRPTNRKTRVATSGLCSLLCGLVVSALLVSGCSSGETNAQRLAAARSRRAARRPLRAPQSTLPRAPSPAGEMHQPYMAVSPSVASPSEVRLVQKVIEEHLQAFGNNDFHRAYQLLTPTYQQNSGSEERLREMITGLYSDFMHVKKVNWQGFSRDPISASIMAFLTFEASDGGLTNVTYILKPQNGRYLIDWVDSHHSFNPSGAPGPQMNGQNPIEEKMFSGVLFSPTPRYRVLDSRSASL